jgi:hypothetical protein
MSHSLHGGDAGAPESLARVRSVSPITVARRRVLSVMRKFISVSRGAALVLGGAVLTVSGQAAAAACPTGSNVVYVSGSTAFAPVVQATQNALGSSVQIVYQGPGSCGGPLYIVGDTGTAVQPDRDAAKVYAPNVAAVVCDLPTTGGSAGIYVDVGISDVYPKTCLNFDPNLNAVGSSTMTKDYYGPIQAMTFAVPHNSTATSISAEAAYMVFRYAAGSTANTVQPWSVPGDIFTRYYDSGTLEMIAMAIGNSATGFLPGANWKNATCSTPGTAACPQTASGSGNMATKLTTAGALSTADANATIGVLGAANYPAGNTLKPLAFQGVGQSCGYLPDSALGAYDKINVRQGRYQIWGPEHLIVNVDSSGNPVGKNGNTAAVQILINALTATSQAPASSSVDGGTSLTETQVGAIIDAIAAPAAATIPQCAMQVQRSAEDGAESSYAPPAPCTCRFLAAATGSAPTCTACTASTTCTGSTPVCRFGYCEAY